MPMNELLANYYGTNGAGQVENLEKQAQAELFAKLAAEEGIDLDAMTDEQVNTLWDRTFSKTASEETGGGGDKKSDEDKKKEEAASEFATKKEASVKLAEADFLGRVMAHAYVDELQKIASGGPGEETPEGETPPEETPEAKEAGIKDKAQKALWAMQGKANKAGKAVGGHLERLGKKVTDKATGGTGAAGAMSPGKAKGVGAGVYGAAGVAGYAGKKQMDKKASAIDELAFVAAVEKVASAGFDSDEAINRLTAILTLGVEESTKIASASDVDGAVDIRSLELLELAGYPVEWTA